MFLAAFCGAGFTASVAFAIVECFVKGFWAEVLFRLLSQATLGVGVCAAAVVAEFDRLERLQCIIQGQQLRKGYTGSLLDAQASLESDKKTIMTELQSSGLQQDVDEAIEVLLGSGMLTPSLREMSKAGNVKVAERVNLYTVTLVTAMKLFFPLHKLAWSLDTRQYDSVFRFFTSDWNWLHVMFSLEPLAFLLIFFVKAEKDMRSYAAMLLSRLWWVPSFCVLWLPRVLAGVFVHTNTVGYAIQYSIVLASLVLVVLGPVRVCCIPTLGPLLIQYLFASWTCGQKEAVRQSSQVRLGIHRSFWSKRSSSEINENLPRILGSRSTSKVPPRDSYDDSYREEISRV